MAVVQTPRLVATDVDGTLLDRNDDITPRTLATVRALWQDGVPFVLVTGRPPRWVGPVVDQLGFAPLAVCANGAVLYDTATERVLHSQTLDVALLQRATEIAREAIPGCGLAAERVGAHDSATPQFVTAPGYAHAWLNPENTEVSSDELTSEPAVKVLVRHSEMASADMAERLLPLFDGAVDLTYSTNNGLVELSAPGVTKASGLGRVATQHGVAQTEVIAFGDMPNDVPMLRWAGHGVAMGNAHPAALAAADEVTGSHTEDGLAQVLERWWT
ncbi:HAD family hydrolase [Rhodococcus sp. X156]|uniref:HAD family hydrolase n=1 Tax=Rhodococcus sp. X156 TaxID=2499145 RepID=UPI001F498B76|nr:HAD family hydrolase [Rhodococcus sp. X156]